MMKEFLEAPFVRTLLIVLIVLILLLLWTLSYSIPIRVTCLFMGYPDSKTLFFVDGPRAFCLNQLEAIEIPLPE